MKHNPHDRQGYGRKDLKIHATEIDDNALPHTKPPSTAEIDEEHGDEHIDSDSPTSCGQAIAVDRAHMTALMDHEREVGDEDEPAAIECAESGPSRVNRERARDYQEGARE